MLRRVFLIVLATSLLLLSTGVASKAGTLSTLPLRVVGTLEFVSDLSVPHYEVGGYVLLVPPTDEKLAGLLGEPVVVIGVEDRNPSVYMRPLLQVIEVRRLDVGSRPAPIQPPVDLFPDPVAPPVVILPQPDPPLVIPPEPSEPPVKDPVPTLPRPPEPHDPPVVILPGHPDPLPSLPPDTNPPVVIPVTPDPLPPIPRNPIVLPTPPPLNGTDRCVLFGRLELTEDRYYVVDPTNNDGPRYWVTSPTLNLNDLKGELIAAIATRAGKATEGPYVLERAVRLSADIADLIRLGQGLIFRLPVKPIRIVLRGSPLQLDATPVVGNDRTLVSLRTISEALGASVSWDAGTRTAIVRLEGREIRATVGSVRVWLYQGNEETTVLSDVSPVIVNGRLMLPLRTLSELFGLNVGWDATSYTVRLD